MARFKPKRPCLHRGCGRYTFASYCPEHEPKRGGTMTGAWRRARQRALVRSRWACERCGSTERLEVHHTDGRGVLAQEHDDALLVVLCRPCHERTFGAR